MNSGNSGAKQQPKKSVGRRKSASAGRRRIKVKRSPADDAVFSKVQIKPGGKTNVIVIHGDPSKPNSILPGGKWDEDDFEAVTTLRQALSKLEDQFTFKILCNHDTLLNDIQQLIKEHKADIVLQFCDEGWMNNPKMELHVTAMLEVVGIPYTGTGPIGLGITSDKQMVLGIARELGIPTPKSIYVEKDDALLNLIKENELEYPLFIKPNHTDGSFGITAKSVVRSEQDLQEALKMIRETFHIQGPILVQEFLEGADLNTAIIGNPPHDYIALPVTEEDFSTVPKELPRLLGFEAKWDEHSPYYRVGTILATSVDDETKKFMNECSAKLFQRISLRDYARFDWKLDKHGKPRLLEANPNCGWSYDAHLQRMCALADISYSEMLKRIIQAAQARVALAAKLAKVPQFVIPEHISTNREQTKQISPNAAAPLKL